MKVTTHRPAPPVVPYVAEYQKFEGFPQPIACAMNVGLVRDDGMALGAEDGTPTLADHLCYLVTMSDGRQYRATSLSLTRLLGACRQRGVEAL